MKILYAEDEHKLSEAVMEVLKIEGYDAVAVYDGQQAVNKLFSEPFDGVILDVMMPELDGFQVLERMRSAQIFTPVLMLTARSATDDIVQGFSAGADYYLPKPFKMAELLARLGAMLRRVNDYKTEEFSKGNTTLSSKTAEVATSVGSLRLSTYETNLLALAFKNIGKDMTADWISENIFGTPDKKDGVSLYISYLNDKLAQIRSDLKIYEGNGIFRMSEVTS